MIDQLVLHPFHLALVVLADVDVDLIEAASPLLILLLFGLMSFIKLRFNHHVCVVCPLLLLIHPRLLGGAGTDLKLLARTAIVHIHRLHYILSVF